MRNTLIVLALIALMLAGGSVMAGDFFGARLTGKHTWGLSFKYDGDPWIGTHYNVRRFTGANPLDMNIKAEIKIDNGISNIDTEFAVTPIFGLKTAAFNKGSFGFGMRWGVRYEHYFPTNPENSPQSGGALSGNLSVKPGYYNLDYAVTANLGIDYVTLYFNTHNTGYNNEHEASGKVDVRPVEDFTVGLHTDYTNSFKGNGRIHITADINQHIYLTTIEDKAWNTWTDGAKDDNDNEGSGLMPQSNLELRAAFSVRF